MREQLLLFSAVLVFLGGGVFRDLVDLLLKPVMFKGSLVRRKPGFYSFQAGIAVAILFILLGSLSAAARPVLAAVPVQVSISAPTSSAPNSDFTARVNISQVADFDACNYTISFNESIIRLDSVTPGLIGSTSVPVDAWNKQGPGVYTVIQNIPGIAGVSGSGYLSELHLHVTGSSGTTSQITMTNGILSDKLAQAISATWAGAAVTVSGGSGATTTAPPPAGGGASGGGTNPASPVTTQGLTSSASLTVNTTTGAAERAVQLKTSDSVAAIDITSGTRLLDAQGKALTTITSARLLSPPAAPAQSAIVLAYNFGPDGAQFNPPITITLKYDPLALSGGIAEPGLSIAFWDGIQWQTLQSTVDTAAKTVSAKTTHFTPYAVIGKKPASSPASPSATAPSPAPSPKPTSAAPAPAPTVAPVPAPAPSSKPAPVITPSPSPAPAPAPAPASDRSDGSFSWVWIGAIIGGVIIVGIVAYFFYMRWKLND